MHVHAADAALLVLRVILGVIFMAHGAQKLFGWFEGPGLTGTSGMVESMGFKPAKLWGLLLAMSEFGGGLLVFVGLITRIAAAAVAIGQFVAIGKVHGRNGFFNANKGFEFNLSLIAICAALIIAGAGSISIDHVIHLPF